jgi:arylsulfatase A-like enzyme
VVSPPPHILWILTTQWRGQSCGYAGDVNARTPAVDALAAGSLNLTAAVTPHPFGPFARAALLTGIPSPENGMVEYYDPLPAGTRTVAHALGERGYTTAFFGKWHLARRDPAAALVGEAHARMVVPPESRGGFGVWEGFESGFLLNDPWLHGTRLDGPTRFPGYQSDVVCERAGAWLAGQRPDRPWFCVVSLEPPHPPYDAPAAGIASPDPADLVLRPNVPRGGPAEARARRELAGYYAHLEATDRAIGRLIGQVGGLGPAAVVFTSVHGDMHGAHGLFRKGWPHEESIRVPLLVRPPSGPGSQGAAVDDGPVSLIDLPRWTLAWAGDPGCARSWPAPRRESVAVSMPSAVRLPLQCDLPWRAIRTRGRKLVLRPDGTPWLHFDLEEDPFEERNLAEDPARAAERAELAASGAHRLVGLGL